MDLYSPLEEILAMCPTLSAIGVGHKREFLPLLEIFPLHKVFCLICS